MKNLLRAALAAMLLAGCPAVNGGYDCLGDCPDLGTDADSDDDKDTDVLDDDTDPGTDEDTEADTDPDTEPDSDTDVDSDTDLDTDSDWDSDTDLDTLEPEPITMSATVTLPPWSSPEAEAAGREDAQACQLHWAPTPSCTTGQEVSCISDPLCHAQTIKFCVQGDAGQQVRLFEFIHMVFESGAWRQVTADDGITHLYEVMWLIGPDGEPSTYIGEAWVADGGSYTLIDVVEENLNRLHIPSDGCVTLERRFAAHFFGAVGTDGLEQEFISPFEAFDAIDRGNGSYERLEFELNRPPLNQERVFYNHGDARRSALTREAYLEMEFDRFAYLRSQEITGPWVPYSDE